MQEAEMRGPWFKASLGKKLGKTLFQKNKPIIEVHTCNPIYIGGRVRRITV
jgi:hypothetical protein